MSDRRVELASLETVTRYVDDLRNLLGESSLTERKSFITTPTRRISQEKVGVLSPVHYSGRYWT
ncbi:MAG: hypothetical protein QMC90_00040 [Dehalococcoidales bacterium]|nr:hypothetical protein [Dehalococcoidales bacterium]